MLPHYLADYELALRVKRAGWRLVVDLSAAVYSCEEYGSSFCAKTWRQRLFSVRSPSYLPAQLGFWWQASNLQQRLTMPFRLLTFLLFPSLRKKA
jgi:GT2 family glycosyltransferase